VRIPRGGNRGKVDLVGLRPGSKAAAGGKTAPRGPSSAAARAAFLARERKYQFPARRRPATLAPPASCGSLRVLLYSFAKGSASRHQRQLHITGIKPARQDTRRPSVGRGVETRCSRPRRCFMTSPLRACLQPRRARRQHGLLWRGHRPRGPLGAFWPRHHLSHGGVDNSRLAALCGEPSGFRLAPKSRLTAPPKPGRGDVVCQNLRQRPARRALQRPSCCKST